MGVLRDAALPTSSTTANFMILPFVDTDLDFLLSDPTLRSNLKPSHVKFILYQILSALHYLHSAELVHSQLNPTCILLDEGYQVKLSGFHHMQSLVNGVKDSGGLTRYSPPEVGYMSDTRPGSYWKATDMWGVGCILAHMLRGKPLFDARDKNGLLLQIFAVDITRPSASDFERYPMLNALPLPEMEELRDLNDTLVSPPVMELLSACLQFDPGKRATALEALQHPCFSATSFQEQTHRTCPALRTEFGEANIHNFVTEQCGGP
eukprot:TRINITY_DN6463_c0_g1_i1.p2 TRINITY_DN6463_c0_g1~~TRINITY_DN6463_c0_g1_i1.p2  ORF type:complete len:264 (-),score=42.13 TRINITY_DN6463_c0_g1_i1:38-829(-)